MNSSMPPLPGLARCGSVAAIAVAAAAFAWSVVPASAGPAIGQFELKDLDAEPGSVEFQSQNAHSWGQPRRKVAEGDEDGELILDDNSVVRQRHALELEAAFTHFLRMRLGIEFEKERFEEPDDIASANAFDHLKLDEIAIEIVTIFARVPESGGIGFGALAEFEAPIEGDELNTIIFGPIVEAKFGPWGAIGNLTFVHSFGNGDRTGTEPADKKWDLAYATQVSYRVSDTWMLALEGYGTFDRLGDSGTPGEEREAFGDHDLHRAGPLVYYSFSSPRGAPSEPQTDAAGLPISEDDDDETGMETTVGVGLLFGLNENTPDHTLKWSIEVEF